MWRVLIASVVVAVALAVGSAAPAQACSCAGGPLTAEALADAEGAFVGTVQGRMGKVIAFEVERVYAGRIGAAVEVSAGTNSASCGIEASLGERLGLFVGKHGGGWQSSLCSVRDPADFEALSAGYEPDGAIGTGLESKDSGLVLVVNLLMAAVAGAAALAFVAWADRRARRAGVS